MKESGKLKTEIVKDFKKLQEQVANQQAESSQLRQQANEL